MLDLDGEDGGDSLRELELERGELPRTVSAATGAGQHYYFKTELPIRNSAGKLAPGLDIRGDGGYVVAPSSLHPSGRAYTWDVDPESVFRFSPPKMLIGSQCGQLNNALPEN